ncbi:MAG: hypothetical protein KME13_00360 [Myxacorys californica WJT36-NPBG1]|nr:hypothetical protein [Myxacorys californica WJT36-NPBG1]
MKRNRAWLLLTGLVAVLWGTALMAVKVLTTLPTFHCETVDEHSFLTARLHCAQNKANQQSPSGLAAAIQQVGDISPEEPLHSVGQELVESWHEQLLALGEAEFQAGNLKEAIRIAQLITERSSIYTQARDRIAHWKATEETAATITQQATRQMEERQWGRAFQTAHQLQQIKSDYWAKQKYAVLVQQIQADREDRDWQLKTPVEPKLPLRNQPVLPSEAAMQRSQALAQPQLPFMPLKKRQTTIPPGAVEAKGDIKLERDHSAFDAKPSTDLEPQLFLPVEESKTLERLELSAVQAREIETKERSALQAP